MKQQKWIGFRVISFSVLLTLAALPYSLGADDGGNCRDEVRADGNIVVDEGRKRAHFHVRGSDHNSSDSGRLDFRDRGGGIQIRSRNLISYEIVDADTRRLTFDIGGSDDPAVVNTAVVTVRDIGRRGRNDLFELSTADYLASGNLRGGQVRIRSRGPGCDDSVDD